MKKIFIVLIMVFVMLGVANAGLLDEAFKDIKVVFNKLEFKTGEFYDIEDDKMDEIFQISLISYKKEILDKQVTMASLDLGYTVDDFDFDLETQGKVITLLTFNVTAITKVLKMTKLDKIPVLPIDIYISVGVGYDFEEKDIVAGIGMVGFKFKF